jgi:hypothetical protein
MAKRIAVFGFWSMLLAAVGVGVSMVGRHFGQEFLAHRVGPAITLGGAGLWLYARLLRRDQG